jgi:hypothetical protein
MSLACLRRDSNPRPSVCGTDALPIELHRQVAADGARGGGRTRGIRLIRAALSPLSYAGNAPVPGFEPGPNGLTVRWAAVTPYRNGRAYETRTRFPGVKAQWPTHSRTRVGGAPGRGRTDGLHRVEVALYQTELPERERVWESNPPDSAYETVEHDRCSYPQYAARDSNPAVRIKSPEHNHPCSRRVRSPAPDSNREPAR